jgi:CRP/FNR family transcriptional regulator, anaerobic regulatory protein
MVKFFDCLQQRFQLNSELRSILLNITTVNSYKKSSIILQQGDIANSLYFCEKGIVKKSINQDNKSITLYFIDAGNFFYSSSLLNINVASQQSLYTLELINAGQIISIPLAKLFDAMNTYPELQLLYNKIIETNYIEEVKRSLELQSLTAIEKYISFVRLQPEVAALAKLKDIASCLGVNQETLSRIRNKLK